MPPILERYELKFVIPEHMVDPISDFASVYCTLDKYSQITDGLFYRVNNLYFDTPNFLFLQRRLEGVENRFNMRIRSYGEEGNLPCFFEIKQKRVNIIKKFRAGVHDEDWPVMFEKSDYDISGKTRREEVGNKELFLRLAHSYNAGPRVLTQYKRKAYVSDVDDYGRVTFDMDLRYMPEERYNVRPDEARMIPNDDVMAFDPDPVGNIILELKCYSTQFPLWMIDLIRYFDLSRRSFSKYITGLRSVTELCRYDPGIRQSALGVFI
ncbi:VTC domain-containing protein [Desulfonema ishimotonii]|uniref:VTC domain-containing protein n=2 Tax=Desulfonema ishimotonii TaxID=45657 RepID=A0A401FQK0_9BACT|nr:VTC domain-containing protein [Desulfonema ishimotonii]